MPTEAEIQAEEHEVHYDFGAIAANAAAVFSVRASLRGDGHTPESALIKYALVDNQSGGSITVQGENGPHVIRAGVAKLVAFGQGAREVRVIAGSTAVAAGEVRADIGLAGCC